MRTLTMSDVQDAPLRSFSAGSALAQELTAWYEAGMQHPAGFLLGEKGDEDRDGSDAQLRDAVCILAGLTRKREPVLNEDGTQATSEKRGKPIFRDIPFSTKDRLEAMRILGIQERELSREGTKRLVAIVKHDGTTDEDEDAGTENENEDGTDE